MMGRRALLLVPFVSLCLGCMEPQANETGVLHRTARSIFDTFGDLVNNSDVDPSSYYTHHHDDAAEQARDLLKEAHSKEIFEKFQEKILDARLVDLVPAGLLMADDSKPTGRSVGGVFSGFRNSLNSMLDEALSWVILQGYLIMPTRMESVMEYLESDIDGNGGAGHGGAGHGGAGHEGSGRGAAGNDSAGHGGADHHLHRREDPFDDDDFVRMMASYQPKGRSGPHDFISPTSAEIPKCPDGVLWYSQCAKVMTMDYLARVTKRAAKALSKVGNYLHIQ